MDGATDAAKIEDSLILYQRAMAAYAYTCTKNVDLAHKLVEESCQLALNHVDERDPEAEIADWLFALVDHCWCSFKDNNPNGPFSPDRSLLHDAASILFLPELYPDGTQDSEQALDAAIAQLPPQEKRLLRLCFGENLSYETAAAKTRLTPAKVKLLVNRALTALRSELFSSHEGNT